MNLGFTPGGIAAAVAEDSAFMNLLPVARVAYVPRRGSRSPHTSTERESQLISALKRCRRAQDLECGKKLHQAALTGGLHTRKKVAEALVTMYCKCQSTALARQVFDSMIIRDVVAWTSLIDRYAENGESSVAMDLFAAMDCEPNYVTYLAVLKACAGLATENELQKHICLEKGISLHKQVKDRGLESNVLVATSLVNLYSKCGSMDQAREVFDRMALKNVIAWSCLILGYAYNGENSVAVALFTSMDCEPDSHTYVAALKAYGGLACEEQSKKWLCLEKGIAIHEQVTSHRLESNLIVANALLEMYSRCGSMTRAREVFDSMMLKNVASWNILIDGYAENGQSSAAMDLFISMDCEPSCKTFAVVLKACKGFARENGPGKQICLEKGIAIHSQVKDRGFESNVFVATTLIDMYSKCGNMERARDVFDRMLCKNAITWTTLILGYVRNGQSSTAIDLFTSTECEPDRSTYVAALQACASVASEKTDSAKHISLEKGIAIHKRASNCGFDSDAVLASSLMDMYGKCGCIDRAREVFDRMVSKDVISWTALIFAYADNGKSLEALDIFSSMDCEPESLTYIAVLKACGNLAALRAGMQIHARACRVGIDGDRLLEVENSLMNFYGKCNCMSKAEEIFNNMQIPDAVSWSILIGGYSSSGDSCRVFSLAKQMQEAGLQPNSATFACLLSACSHSGLVEEGMLYFQTMLENGECLSLGHYNCIVDMLCRANRLEEALALIKRMPFEADRVVWTTLLGASTRWKNLEVGKIAFDALAAAEPTQSSAYVLMSDIYTF